MSFVVNNESVAMTRVTEKRFRRFALRREGGTSASAGIAGKSMARVAGVGRVGRRRRGAAVSLRAGRSAPPLIRDGHLDPAAYARQTKRRVSRSPPRIATVADERGE